MSGLKALIIGGVAGGASAAARLRRLDETADILILERSGFISYANCGLPYFVGGDIQEQRALTLQTPQSFWNRFRIEARVRNEAIAIDRARKTVTVRRLDDGTEYEERYDKLILSPGAKAVRPPLPGIGSERVVTLRTVEDAVALRDRMRDAPPQSAVVVGGGYVGLEMAENLMGMGVETTVVEQQGQLLSPLDYDMACEVHAYLQDKGLSLLLGRSVAGFEDQPDGVRVRLESGETLDAGLVVLAIGVQPDTQLARDAGLTLGVRGAIVVDDRLRTSDPDIYAVGDAVEVRHLITGEQTLIPLAGPANKQGRIAADNLCGRDSRYRGSQGSSILKLFDLTVAATGLNARAARAAGLACEEVVTFSASHAAYYPGATNMTVKTLFDPDSGRLLGAQIVGFDGVDKRIDVLATALRAGLTAADLAELELAYAPPFSSAKDPVNMAGFVMENVRGGLVRQYHWYEVDSLPRDGSVTLLDTRTEREYAGGHIDGTVHIPLDSLRDRLGELDPAKPVYVNCHSGLRSYIACRILTQHGFTCCNLSGGYRFYALIRNDCGFDATPAHPCGLRLGEEAGA